MKENELRPESMYNTRGLSDALGMAERVIRDKANKGDLPAYKWGKKWFFKGSDIIALIESKGEKNT